MTALQEQTERDYQARITGLMESLGAAMPGVGFLLGGAIVALSSPRAAYAVAGAGLLLLLLARSPCAPASAQRVRDWARRHTGPRSPRRVRHRPTAEAGVGRDGR